MNRIFGVLALLAAWGCSPNTVLSPSQRDADADGTADVVMMRCASDRDCSARGLVCDVTRMACVECNAASDCDAGRVCSGNRCVNPVPCTSSRMCPGQVCSARQGYCVDCEVDADCASGQVCRLNACVSPPRACRSSRECSDLSQVCDPARGQCVECIADADCPAGRFCGADAACLRRACEPNATSCVNATRVRMCDARGSAQTESDCPSGQTCRGGGCQAAVCTPGQTSCDPTSFERRRCDEDGGGYSAAPCAMNEACRDGLCVAQACTPGAATCASATERRVCDADGLSTSTVACTSNEGCRDGACVARSCVPEAATCASSTVRSVCNADGFGATSTPCGTTQRCVGGSCVDLACTPGSSTCVDARTVRVCSSDGVSAMNLTCPASSTCTGTMCSSWTCVPGSATCPPGATSRVICNADGLGTRSEACATPANAGMARCGADNACTFSCNAGFGDCNLAAADGCEVALATSASNCGRCGNACPPRANMTAGCAAGACDYRCNAGFGDCDGNAANGCEASLAVATNCGRCGVACSATQRCVADTCVAATGGSNYTLTTPPASVTFVDVCNAPSSSRVLFGVDDGAVTRSLPFAFRYWGLPMGETIYLTTNGFLSFEAGMGTPTAGTIPSSSRPNGVVAAWWMDLLPMNLCYVTLGTAPNRRFAIEWAAAVYMAAGRVEVELIFNESENTIDVLTQTYTLASSTTATVGLESPDGTRAVGGCDAGRSTICTNARGNRIRFAPSP